MSEDVEEVEASSSPAPDSLIDRIVPNSLPTYHNVVSKKTTNQNAFQLHSLSYRSSLKRFRSEPTGLNIIAKNLTKGSEVPIGAQLLHAPLQDGQQPSPATPSRSRHSSSTHSLAGVSGRLNGRNRLVNLKRQSVVGNYMAAEVALEKYVRMAQQVSLGFNHFSLEESGEERKRTRSLTEPISILTNAFLPSSCSPSPTRGASTSTQCYSPSTHQIVRNNIPYSPSPSPTPSPTRRIMRSLSPIAVRPVLGGKRKYVQTTNGSTSSSCSSANNNNNNNSNGVMDSEMGSEGGCSYWIAPKRVCGGHGNTSPLVGQCRDRLPSFSRFDSNSRERLPSSNMLSFGPVVPNDTFPFCSSSNTESETDRNNVLEAPIDPGPSGSLSCLPSQTAPSSAPSVPSFPSTSDNYSVMMLDTEVAEPPPPDPLID